MFDQNEYRQAFSKVTASDETYRRILDMTNENKRKKGGRTLARILLVAAIVSLLAVTVSAAEYVQSWFTKYFSEHTEAALSTEQIVYIEEKEQNISESQTVDGWTVEVKSAINDGRIAYIIIGVEAPENVNLTPRKADGVYKDWFGAGNSVTPGLSDLISNSAGIWIDAYSTTWEEDGDGLDNTKNIIIELESDFTDDAADPFDSAVEWYIHIEDIVGEYENTEYLQELLNGKYNGQENIMFTDEEAENLYNEVTLVEGVWDFTITFNGEEPELELIDEPVAVSAAVGWKSDGTDVYEDIKVTSFVLRSLSASIYADVPYAPEFSNNFDRLIYVVMKDGSQIPLHNTGGSPGMQQCIADVPIILENVDHVLMPDGTRLTVPE